MYYASSPMHGEGKVNFTFYAIIVFNLISKEIEVYTYRKIMNKYN